jgi:SAM-dependent methyltransferase
MEIARHYPAEYAAYHTAPGMSDGRFIDRMGQMYARQRCETVLRYRSGGDVLDCGCGSGDFLVALQTHAGWRVRGLEPYAPDVAERARQQYGITVDEVSLDHAPYADGSFDVVTLWEVFEHLPQPVEALRRIHALLRPGGLLVLSLPNRTSFLARIFGASWVGLDIPRHFSVFSPAHIRKAALAAGFSSPDIFTERGPLGSAQTELLCLLLSSYYWINSEQSPGRIRRVARSAFSSLALQPAVLIFLFLLIHPYSVMARMLNRGSQMVVVARRE